MRFFASATLFSLLLAVGLATAAEHAADVGAREVAHQQGKRADGGTAAPLLEKRACSDNGCKCKKGVKQGQYCGYCAAVTAKGKGGSWEHVFECSPSGGCCSYGKSDPCASEDWSDLCPK